MTGHEVKSATGLFSLLFIIWQWLAASIQQQQPAPAWREGQVC